MDAATVARKTASAIVKCTVEQAELLVLTAIQEVSNVELMKRREAEERIRELESDVKLYRDAYLRLAKRELI